MPTIIVIGGQPSAQVLRDALAQSGAAPTQNLTVCWGACPPAADDRPDVRVLNGVPRVNALDQLTNMEQSGILVPTWTADPNLAKDWVRGGALVWGRFLEHTQGNDIIGPGYRPRRMVQRLFVGKEKPERWNEHWLARDWWVKVVDPADIVDEWRVHIFMGRSICVGKKVQTGQPTRKQLVRSRRNGWTLDFSATMPAGHPARESARKAVEAVGYHFGAVDILELRDGSAMVLEVNSAPALGSPQTINAYTQAVLKAANGKYQKWYEGGKDV